MVTSAAFGLLLVFVATASAVGGEDRFVRFGSIGAGPSELHIPLGVDTDPQTGAVYVADLANHRISKFDPWGDFLEAWGWGVSSGDAEFQHCTESCQVGIPGEGAGQFTDPGGVAVDSAGNVYTYDPTVHRVQKFSPAGEFIFAIGGEVDKTTHGNLCTAASHDECGAGVAGSGPAEFDTALGFQHIAVDAQDRLLFGGKDRIQFFEPNGTFETSVALPGKDILGLAYDPASNGVYVTYVGKPDLEKLSLTGVVLDSLDIQEPEDFTVSDTGTVYVIEAELGGVDPDLLHAQRVVEFDNDGTRVSVCCEAEPAPREPAFSVFLRSLATNSVGDLYVTAARGDEASYVTAYGPPPADFGPPPPAAPTVTRQLALSSRSDSAELAATINPRFWSDTTYYVEYGTGKCSQGGCPAKLPLSPAILTAKVLNAPVRTGGILLPGLAPSSRYHYRFVSESGGGGPVFGIDPDGEGPEEASFAHGLEGTFSTFAEAEPPDGACPNQEFRAGRSEALPDCRAYEMVSPVDKANGDILALIDVTGFETHLNQSSADGDRITYSSYRAFGGAQGASYTSQYIASRDAGGWSSEALAEARGPGGFYGSRLAGENEYKAFSPDLCQAWLVREAEPQLALGAVTGFPNLYRRDNCPKAYEALSTTEPPNVAPADYAPELQGYSADGAKAIFRVNDKLTADATAGRYQLYEASGGTLSLVCVLPNGTPFSGECSAGSPPTAQESSFNRTASVDHAMSEDGSKVYWSASAPSVLAKPGKLYLRLDGQVTLPVSEAAGSASSLPAQFWGASPDGSRAIFTITEGAKAGNLYRYDLGEESSTLLAAKVIGVAGGSEDLSYVYFISEAAIGGDGVTGKPNLYAHHEDATSFIATLSRTDVQRSFGGPRLPSNATSEPIYHAAQATPDGRRLVFISNEPLTGADNADALTGNADSEVFTYSADGKELHCVSCSPVGAAPVGRMVQAQAEGTLATAASLPVAENQLYRPRAISADGSRVFFTAYADILPQDSNHKADVYEWERPGAGSCSEARAAFYAANGGCLYLITTGQDGRDSQFIDASRDGRDVFFSTGASLRAEDPGAIDIYDARAGGGFPAREGQPNPCFGEGCQRASPPPNFPSPTSTANRPGNPPSLNRCARGKARRKGRCVRTHVKRNKHRHGAARDKGNKR